MKNKICIAFILFSISTITYSQSKLSTSLFSTEKLYDFGSIKEQNGIVSHSFRIENKGKIAISIDEVITQCGCTKATFTKKKIMPGTFTNVTITFDPAYRPGFFSKELVILSNNRTEYTRIWINGTVIPNDHPVEEDHPYSFGDGLHLSHKVLYFVKPRQGEKSQIKLRYANSSAKKMNLTFILEPDNKNISFTNPGHVAPNKRGEIQFTYTRHNEVLGDKSILIYPCINGKRLLQPITVRIR